FAGRAGRGRRVGGTLPQIGHTSDAMERARGRQRDLGPAFARQLASRIGGIADACPNVAWFLEHAAPSISARPPRAIRSERPQDEERAGRVDRGAERGYRGLPPVPTAGAAVARRAR